jgi:exopolysaccharide biosynthesis polyprenyl glycosylphosphotransferase
MYKKFQTIKYIVADFFAALLAWFVFFLFRKISIEQGNFNDINQVFDDRNFYLGLIFIPIFWLLLYWAQGTYKEIYKKSRLKDLSQTFFISILGVIVIFFSFLLDDNIVTYKNYYLSFCMLFILHFSLTYLPRFILTTITVHKVHNGKIGFPTLMIVSNMTKAKEIYQEINKQEISSGYSFIGYLTLDEEEKQSINDENKNLPKLLCLGDLSILQEIINIYHVEEVIVVLKKSDENKIFNIISSIQDTNIEIFIPADRKDLINGSIKFNAIFHIPLVQISQHLMPYWEFSVKRMLDILVSLISIILLIPTYIIVGLIVFCTSKGSVIYSQKRIGKGGKEFNMYKFRSMYMNAEKDVPMLSNGDKDSRITPFGRFMRKVRLDEIPQFFNVLIGNMSMVGWRPERQYFINQIVEKAPEYHLLQKIKPGMTSWGQVKYGYADNVDQMVERLQYDLLYLENMSIATDIKILIYTFFIIFQGRGK